MSRKMKKRKLRSCNLCKPNKVGGACRWTPKERVRLKDDEKACRDALGKKEED